MPGFLQRLLDASGLQVLRLVLRRMRQLRQLRQLRTSSSFFCVHARTTDLLSLRIAQAEDVAAPGGVDAGVAAPLPYSVMISTPSCTS